MRWLLFALSLSLLLSCSSLEPVPSSPDTSSGDVKPPTPDNSLNSLIETSKKQTQDWKELALILRALRGDSDPLMQIINDLQTSNENALKELANVSNELNEAQTEVKQSRQDLSDYRRQVISDKLRDGIMIGGIGGLVGLIIGLIIGALAR